MIKVDLSNIQSFLRLPYEAAVSPRLKIAHSHLQLGNGRGGEFTGWVHLPRDYDRAEYERIKAAAKKIQSDSKALVVIGIGGSYLGARGVIECLCSPNYNLKKKNTPNIYFIGNGLSSEALTEVMELVEDVDFSVNVISKSGTTTEPAVAFRFFRELLEKRYGKDEAARRNRRPQGCAEVSGGRQRLRDLRGARQHRRPLQRADRRGPAAHCRRWYRYRRADERRAGDDGDLRRRRHGAQSRVALRRSPV